jgi:hypothetical protein
VYSNIYLPRNTYVPYIEELPVIHLYTAISTAYLIRQDLRGASKIKLKNVNKKRMATARRLIFFWNFSRRGFLLARGKWVLPKKMVEMEHSSQQSETK